MKTHRCIRFVGMIRTGPPPCTIFWSIAVFQYARWNAPPLNRKIMVF